MYEAYILGCLHEISRNVELNFGNSLVFLCCFIWSVVSLFSFLSLSLERCLIRFIAQYSMSYPSFFHLKLNEWTEMSTSSYVLYFPLVWVLGLYCCCSFWFFIWFVLVESISKSKVCLPHFQIAIYYAFFSWLYSQIGCLLFTFFLLF